jgi:hypothetical protein
VSKTLARLSLEQPFLDDHRTSVAVVASRAAPRGLGPLVGWFLVEWAQELPASLHKGDVWRDYVRLDEERKAEGGSRLGSPQYAEGFRRYIEGSPFETDSDGRYARPIHAAIARIAGRGDHGGMMTRDLPVGPFMARFLFRFAVCGDLTASCDSMGLPPQAHAIYAEQVLYRLWKTYAVGPQLQSERVA